MVPSTPAQPFLHTQGFKGVGDHAKLPLWQRHPAQATSMSMVLPWRKHGLSNAWVAMQLEGPCATAVILKPTEREVTHAGMNCHS